jgi:hypothetical protein
MKIRILAAALIVAAFTVVVPAASAQSLPDVDLTAPNGSPISASTIAPAGRWLLVYVFPSAAPSDRLLQWLGETWTPQHADRVIFIVAAEPEAAKKYLADKGGEGPAAARWYADPKREAWRAFKFQGTLAVSGMENAAQDWKLDGVIDDITAIAEAVAAWVLKVQ